MERGAPSPDGELFQKAAKRVALGEIRQEGRPTSSAQEIVWLEPKAVIEGFERSLLPGDRSLHEDETFPVTNEALPELAPEIVVPDWVRDHGERLSLGWRTYQAAARIFPRHEVPHPEQGPIYLRLLCELSNAVRRETMRLYDDALMSSADARELLESVQWEEYEAVPQPPADIPTYEQITPLGAPAERFVHVHSLLVDLGGASVALSPSQEAQWSQAIEYHQDQVIAWARQQPSAPEEAVLVLLSLCDIGPNALNDYGTH